jgi:hypothetical protein
MKLHAFPHHAFLPKNLGQNIDFTWIFGIILKYYSQGLKPLGSTLSLSFQPSSPPIPYPLFGILVPHHSFIVVGLYATVFIFLLMFCMITYTKAGSQP